jgi:hypothetical protein
MRFTPRSLFEFVVGMGLVILAVYWQFSSENFGVWNDLVLSVMGLVGVIIMAHAVWLLRQKE